MGRVRLPAYRIACRMAGDIGGDHSRKGKGTMNGAIFYVYVFSFATMEWEPTGEKVFMHESHVPEYIERMNRDNSNIWLRYGLTREGVE